MKLSDQKCAERFLILLFLVLVVSETSVKAQQLTSFWNDMLRSHATVVGDGRSLGKNWVGIRDEVGAQTNPFVEFGVTRTVPLYLYRDKEGRSRSLATPGGISRAIDDGFTSQGVIAHVWIEPPRFLQARSLRQYVHPATNDYFLVSSPQSEREALAAGYRFLRNEGYTFAWTPLEFSFAYLRFPWSRKPVGESIEPPDLSWGRLLAGDPQNDGFTLSVSGGTNFNLRQDRFSLTIEDGEPGFITFTLVLSPDATWRKRLTVAPRAGNQSISFSDSPVATIDIEGAERSQSIRLPVTDLIGRSLWLAKSGVQTGPNIVHELSDLTAMSGRRVTFRWLRDNEGGNENAALGWESFTERLPQGDLIRLTVTPGSPGFATFILANTRRTTWWKQIQLVGSDRVARDSVSLQDRTGAPVSLRIPNTQLYRSRLRFSKAMLLGVHTDIYELGDLGLADGKTVTFEWLRDTLPDPYAQSVLEWRAGFRLLEDHWGVKTWNGMRCDGDEIHPQVENLPPGQENMLELVIQLDGSATWWKAIRLFNIFDDFITEEIADGPHARSQAIRGRFEEFWWANLVFAKAKFLGKHEDKYEYQLSPFNLNQIGAAPGKRVVFVWSRDDGPRGDGC